MNILIVDGNEKKHLIDILRLMGMPTQFKVYENVLRKLVKKDCQHNYFASSLHGETIYQGELV